MWKRMGWGVLVGVVVLLLGAAVWWWTRPKFVRQSATAANGLVLTLRSAQVGRTFIDPYASEWQQLLAQVPPAVARKLRIPQAARVTSAESNAVLNVWLEAGAGPAQGGQSYGLAVGDDDGNFAGSIQHLVRVGKTPGGTHYEGHVLRVFPRRSPMLRVRVYKTPWDKSSALHEFRIPNPAPVVEAPRLAGRPLPQVAADGDLEASLEAFIVGPEEWERNPDPAQRRARLEFSVRQGGQPTTNWVSYHVRRAVDGSGNVTDGNSWRHGWESGRSHVAFSQWPLPAGEPWKVDVEFCQTDGFEAGRVWHLAKLPLKLDGSAVTGVSNVIEGRVLSVTRFGPSRMNPSGPDDQDLRAELEVSVTGSAPDSRRWHISVLKAVDSTGRVLSRSGWSGSDDLRSFELALDPKATSIDLWLAYAPSRVLTFVAQPEVRTNNPASSP